MTSATITAEIHEPFDIHRDFPPEIPLDRQTGYFASNRVEIFLGEIQAYVLGVDSP